VLRDKLVVELAINHFFLRGNPLKKEVESRRSKKEGSYSLTKEFGENGEEFGE